MSESAPSAPGLSLRVGNSTVPAPMVLALFVLFSAISAGSPTTDSATAVWTSRSGDLQVSYSSNLEPLVINRMHSWVLHVETSNGTAVADASISVAGGMPEHDHGLPTRPQVTRHLGEGNYLLEGLRFHMPGKWEILVTIDAFSKQDVVTISLTL